VHAIHSGREKCGEQVQLHRRKAQGESLADLVLGQQHVGDAAADLVDVLAVGADHLAFDDVDLSEASSKEFLARSKSKRQQSVL
jgi:hypothetical protein